MRAAPVPERGLERVADDLRDGDAALRGALLHPSDEIVVGLNDETAHGIMISAWAARPPAGRADGTCQARMSGRYLMRCGSQSAPFSLRICSS